MQRARIAYNSCRSRNCPKYRSLARAEWIEARRAALLDSQYFHIVFTVPDQLAAIVFQRRSGIADHLAIAPGGWKTIE
nr:transposase zinc-binding domain-containing protein [Bradyrhizobium sp. 139]